MPIAVRLPRSQKGGASEKFRLKKPTIVVRLVITTAWKLMRRLSFKAVILSWPSRISVSIDIKMCTLSAIARVRMMVGAVMDIGANWIPM